MTDKHIRITPAKLRAMIKAAYEEGYADGGSAMLNVRPEAMEYDWGQSAVYDNLNQDLAKAAQSGGLE